MFSTTRHVCWLRLLLWKRVHIDRTAIILKYKKIGTISVLYIYFSSWWRVDKAKQYWDESLTELFLFLLVFRNMSEENFLVPDLNRMLQWVSVFVMAVATFYFMDAVNSCNEAVCASVVSKCMLTQSCKCDLKNCSCCKECFNCLGDLYSECCSCVGQWKL